MASRIETHRVERALKRAADRAVLAELAVAVYQKPLRDGLMQQLRQRQGGEWPPNSEEWRKKKRRKGWGQRPWERTGRTLQSLTGNAPSKLGTKKGMKVGVNWRNSVAFAQPRAFTDSKGKKLPGDKQATVFSTLKRGGALAKIAASASRRGRGFLEYLSGTYGPTSGARARAARGSTGIPARPLFVWSRDWEPEIEADVEKAIGEVFEKQGFLFRAGLKDAR